MGLLHKCSTRHLHSGAAGCNLRISESAPGSMSPAAYAAGCSQIPAWCRLQALHTSSRLRAAVKREIFVLRRRWRLLDSKDHQSCQNAIVARLALRGRTINVLPCFYSAEAAAGAAAIASTISGGSPNLTCSGITSSSLTLPKPFEDRNCTTSSTRHSGAEAPAVRAIVLTPSNHSGLMFL